MSPVRRGVAVLAALAVGLAAQTARAQAKVLEPAPADVEATELSRRAARALAGERTWMEAALSLHEGAGAASSELVFRAWYERSSRRSFLRVLAPESRAGTGVLRLPPVVWGYRGADASVESVAPAQLREPWLGTGFPLDELLDPPAGLGRAEARLLGVDPGAGEGGTGRAWVLELRPEAGGRVIAWLEEEHATPLRCEWRDENDALVATLRFDAVREVAGRPVPHRWTFSRTDAPGRESRLELRAIRFDPAFDDAIFTTGRLLQRGSVTPAAPDARLAGPGGSPP
jgi:hypothetical protein